MIRCGIVISKKLHSLIEYTINEKIGQAEVISLQVWDVALECTQLTRDKVIISSSLGKTSSMVRSLDDILKRNLIWSANQHEILCLRDSEIFLFKEVAMQDMNETNFEKELRSVSTSIGFWLEYLANENKEATTLASPLAGAAIRI